MYKKYVFQYMLLTVCLTCLLSLAGAQPVQAASAEGGSTAYLILVDKLSINDLDAELTPELYRLTQQGAVGLASSRTLRSRNTIDCSLTLGAGNLARGYKNDLLGFNKEEIVPGREKDAGQLYQSLTGTAAEGRLLLVNTPEILEGLNKEHVNTVPGAMGEILKANRLKVCVLGNGDKGGDKIRPGIAVGMDSGGQVPLGDVAAATRHHTAESHLSFATDYEYLSAQIRHYHSQADLIIIDLSDLARLEVADTASPEISGQAKKMYLGKIDQMVATVSRQINCEQDLIMLVGLSPAAEEVAQKNNFTPIVMYGKGISSGCLTSITSRRDYIVANTDVAPTILRFFNLSDQKQVMIGQAMFSQPAQGVNNLAAAKKLSADTSMANRLRPVVIKAYVILQIISILLALIVIFWIKRGKRLIKPLLVSMVAIPLVLLPLNKINMAGEGSYLAAALIFTVILTILVMYLCKGNGLRSFVLISSITVIMLNLDVILGAPLIKSSLLGYDPMSGARYYGIGNEYMGILIGSSIAVAAALYEKYKNNWVLAIIAAFFAFECYLIAGPSLGANSDGFFTAPVAFILTILLLRQVKMRPRVIATLLLAMILIAAGGAIYDMLRPVEMQTHIGRAANQLVAGGWQDILLIIKRKVAMNIKLIRYTIWSYVFMVILLVVSLLLVRPVGAMQQLRQQYPYIFKGFIGIIVAAFVALVINDSGIVAASTTSIYLVFPILLLMLKLDRPKENEAFSPKLPGRKLS